MANALAQLIADRARRTPDKPYLLDGHGSRTVTWADLHRATSTWAARLATRLPGTVCVMTGDPLPTAAALLGALAAGRDVAPLDGNAPAAATAELLERIGPAVVLTPSELDPGPYIEWPAGDAGPGSLLLFSSGSTGPRKPVRLSENALLAAARNVVDAHELTEHDRGLCPLPLHHVNAEVVGLLATLVSGGSLVLPGGVLEA